MTTLSPLLLDRWACPRCRGALSLDGGPARCAACAAAYPVVDGIPCFERPAPEAPPTGGPDLSIVILSLNEAANVPALLAGVDESVKSLGVSAEVIVVDGGSTDGTAEAAEAAGARVVRQKARGFGRALAEGFAAARARRILTMDADLSHPAPFIARLWEARERGDVVVASRYVPGSGFDAPALRRVLSRILNALFRRLLSVPVRDMSSNFRLYDAAALAGLSIEGVHFEALQEILIKVHMDGGRLAEVPFHYAPRGGGRSKARIIRFGLRLLRMLFRLWRLRSSIAAADYDDRAHDSRIPLQRWWQRRRHAILLRDAAEAGGVLLDAGCGSARLMSALPRAVGLDIRLNKLRYLRGKAAALVQGSIFSLPFRDACFDAVISSQVIEHVPAGDAPFQEMARVIRPGGLLVIGTPDYGRPWWPAIEWLYARIHPQGYADEHITHYTEPSLKALLDRHGFEWLSSEWILGAELVVRARRRAA